MEIKQFLFCGKKRWKLHKHQACLSMWNWWKGIHTDFIFEQSFLQLNIYRHYTYHDLSAQSYSIYSSKIFQILFNSTLYNSIFDWILQFHLCFLCHRNHRPLRVHCAIFKISNMNQHDHFSHLCHSYQRYRRKTSSYLTHHSVEAFLPLVTENESALNQ